MSLTFDDIHTQKKQENLSRMMEQVCRETLAIPNETPRLDACPLCGSSIEVEWTRAYGYPMSRCETCRLIFCNPYPNRQQLDHYYTSEMKQFENEFFRESFEKRVELFRPRVEILSQVVGSGSVLDIGSAIGIFCESVRRAEADFSLTCCELNPEACIELESRYPDFEVHNCNIFDFTPRRQYDAITLWDTIEHIVDGHALLGKLHSLLHKNGVVVFSTPNTNSFEWMTAGKKHVQLLPPGHVNLYGSNNIERLLRDSRFLLDDIFTLNGSLDISYIQKQLANGTLSVDEVGPFLADRLNDPDFTSMLTDTLIRNRMAGNMVVVARKA